MICTMVSTPSLCNPLNSFNFEYFDTKIEVTNKTIAITTTISKFGPSGSSNNAKNSLDDSRDSITRNII